MNSWTIGNETLRREGMKWYISLLVEGYHKGAPIHHRPGHNEVREVSSEEAGEFLRRWRDLQARIEEATKDLKPVSRVAFENVDLGDGYVCIGRQIFDEYGNFILNLPAHIGTEADLREWFARNTPSIEEME